MIAMNALLLLAQQTQTTPAATPGDNSLTLLAAVILIILAIGLFMAEVLIPSGGILGFISAGLLVTGVVMLCLVNLTWGLIVAIIALCALPFALGFAISIWPDTPIGRWLTLHESQKPANVKPQGAQADPRLGKEGVALTDLHPIGTCLIEGEREPCATVSGMIESGAAVRVVGVDAMQLRVERVEA